MPTQYLIDNLPLTSHCVGAAEKDDLQEKITSSGREQIESFIGAVSEKITPPAPEARSGPGGHFASRQVCSPCKALHMKTWSQGDVLFSVSSLTVGMTSANRP